MSEDMEDLDALFDAIASQRESAGGQAVPAPAAQLAESIEPAACAAAGGEASEPPPMYDRLGLIVRQLHDAIRELGYDRSLTQVVNEISDSQSRLEYIASLTEQAANKVLNAVDEGLPVQEEQVQRAQQLSQRWQAMYAGQLSVEDFKLLAADSRDFSAAVAQSSELEKARLMDIMMAQDFQDITGQIIKKVVALTQKLERELAQLLHDYAPNAPRDKVVDLLSGPEAPASAMAQDQVDRLLADLGF